MAKLRRLHVEHRRPGTHAGVGHHGIDATELLNAGINGRSHGVGIANIALRNHASAGPEFLCQRLHCGPIDVHEKEPCATAVQRARRACADSTAGPVINTALSTTTTALLRERNGSSFISGTLPCQYLPNGLFEPGFTPPLRIPWRPVDVPNGHASHRFGHARATRLIASAALSKVGSGGVQPNERFPTVALTSTKAAR